MEAKLTSGTRGSPPEFLKFGPMESTSAVVGQGVVQGVLMACSASTSSDGMSFKPCGVSCRRCKAPAPASSSLVCPIGAPGEPWRSERRLLVIVTGPLTVAW